MPVTPGKPGTRRITGRVRAQIRVGDDKLLEIIAYSDKLALRVPPVVLLTAPDRAALIAASQVLNILLIEVNV